MHRQTSALHLPDNDPQSVPRAAADQMLSTKPKNLEVFKSDCKHGANPHGNYPSFEKQKIDIKKNCKTWGI